MIGDAVLYAANRATSSALEGFSRQASWIGAAIILMIVGLVFGLICVFWILAPEFGSLQAGAMIAAGCFAAGLIFLWVPNVIAWLNRPGKEPEPSLTATVNAVQEEAKEAVDYFGAMQVMTTAFMLGLGAARRVKSR